MNLTVKNRGKGICLSIFKEITELYNGSVRLLEGTTTETIFQITIPKKPPIDRLNQR